MTKSKHTGENFLFIKERRKKEFCAVAINEKKKLETRLPNIVSREEEKKP
jgi:hypothetical protein